MQNPTVTACICAFVKTTDILRFSFVLNSLVLRIKSCWVSYPRLSLAAARLERDTHRNRLDAGYNPARLKREKKAEDAEKDLIEKSAETVGQLINEFFHAEINDQVKTAIPIKQAMDKYILENLGELKIEAVKPLHIRAMLKSIASPTVARKVLSLTKRMFNYAIKNGAITVNPAAAFNTKDTGGAQDPRKRYLSEAELIQLFSAMARADKFTRHHYLVTKLLLLIGCRKGELFKAKRSDFDLINATSRHEEERCYYICPIILH